jgi:hypothetical protein
MQDSGNDEDGGCWDLISSDGFYLSLPDRLLGSGTIRAFLNLDF